MNNTISFRQETCRITLSLPRLCEMPAKNLRKAFSMLLSEPWNNQGALDGLQRFLPDMVVQAKADWEQASRNYQNGWRLIEPPTRRRTRQEVQADAAIRANNEALIRAVKKSKALYERWVKIQQLWEDTKHRMNYR